MGQFLTNGVYLVIVLGVISLSKAEDDRCEIRAVAECHGQSTDLTTAVASNDINRICDTYRTYRECLYAETYGCDQDFITVRLGRTCTNRCFGCGGAGGLSPGVLTMAVAVFLGFSLLKFRF
ncbi:uncharacterized protein LOC135480343 [Liolophura sinensis]|uniref:uncharacterized protein LOC135480343 n=1 Tax=Liolophura sinensis TaxID=3198878 RepID=UPI003158DD92